MEEDTVKKESKESTVISEIDVEKAIQKIQKDTDEIINIDQVRELIKTNVREFDHKGSTYRTQKPNFDQKYEVSQAQSKKYISMLKDPEYALESDLIEIYKKRGIDISDLDKQFDAFKKEKEEIDKKLGKGLEDQLPESDLEILDSEIKKLQDKQQSVMMEKSVLLNDSIESQLNVYSYTYLSYLITEKNISKDPEKSQWIHPWKSYEEFTKEDESLINVLIWFTMFIARDEIKAF